VKYDRSLIGEELVIITYLRTINNNIPVNKG
jgi:hypothetical protein